MSATDTWPDLSEVPTTELAKAVAGYHTCFGEGPLHCDPCIAVEAELFGRMKGHLRQALLAAATEWDTSYATEWLEGAGNQLADEMWPDRNAWRESLKKPPKREPISRRLVKEIMERDAYRCRICLTWKDLCIDHIYPVALGGATEPDNLQVLCRPCNGRKGVHVE